MEIQGASCDPVNIDFKELLELNDLERLKDNDLMEKFNKSYTPQKWEQLVEKLEKYLNPDELERALRILRPLHVDSTDEDRLNNSVNFLIICCIECCSISLGIEFNRILFFIVAENLR